MWVSSSFDRINSVFHFVSCFHPRKTIPTPPHSLEKEKKKKAAFKFHTDKLRYSSNDPKFILGDTVFVFQWNKPQLTWSFVYLYRSCNIAFVDALWKLEILGLTCTRLFALCILWWIALSLSNFLVRPEWCSCITWLLRLFQHKTFSSFRNHPTIIPENKTKGLILKYKHKILEKEFLAVILIPFNNKLIGWR